MAGVIKMVMGMRHGPLPQTLHVDEPSSHVDWESGRVQLLTEARKWPAGERVRGGGGSCFGVGGTNTRIIREGPWASGPVAVEPAGPAAPLPVVVSARTDAALRAQAERLR
ncbi:hypothetical protein VM98_35385, partial [Streptomyces rubellomurinus subsp. indigoferus]